MSIHKTNFVCDVCLCSALFTIVQLRRVQRGWWSDDRLSGRGGGVVGLQVADVASLTGSEKPKGSLWGGSLGVEKAVRKGGFW